MWLQSYEPSSQCTTYMMAMHVVRHVPAISLHEHMFLNHLKKEDAFAIYVEVIARRPQDIPRTPQNAKSPHLH